MFFFQFARWKDVIERELKWMRVTYAMVYVRNHWRKTITLRQNVAKQEYASLVLRLCSVVSILQVVIFDHLSLWEMKCITVVLLIFFSKFLWHAVSQIYSRREWDRNFKLQIYFPYQKTFFLPSFFEAKMYFLGSEVKCPSTECLKQSDVNEAESVHFCCFFY